MAPGEGELMSEKNDGPQEERLRAMVAAAYALEDPPPVKNYPLGTWGPNAIHQLIAPNAWRLPFERAWRDPNKYGV